MVLEVLMLMIFVGLQEIIYIFLSSFISFSFLFSYFSLFFLFFCFLFFVFCFLLLCTLFSFLMYISMAFDWLWTVDLGCLCQWSPLISLICSDSELVTLPLYGDSELVMLAFTSALLFAFLCWFWHDMMTYTENKPSPC